MTKKQIYIKYACFYFRNFTTVLHENKMKILNYFLAEKEVTFSQEGLKIDIF